MLTRYVFFLVTAVLTNIPAQSNNAQGQDLFGGFEAASLINPKRVGPNHFTIEVQDNRNYGNQGTLMTWACGGIRLGGKSRRGDSVRVVVLNGNKSANLRAVYSYDRRTWRPVLVQRTSFDFDVPLEPGRKAVYFATFYPYTYSEMTTHNKLLARRAHVRFGVAGRSVHRRDIPLVTITDPSVPDSRKQRAFVLGGTHGQENTSLYGVEGMLDFLAGDDQMAQEMRRTVVWKVAPLQNVDAAAEGLDRRNSAGINLYFDWGFHEEMATNPVKNPTGASDPSISKTDFSQPETRSVFDAIVSFRPHVFLDVHSWHFSGDGYWGPDPAETSIAIDKLKQSIANFFRIRHWNHEIYPYASAPTIARKLKIAATLPEFALSYDNDGQMKTPASMRKQGVAILEGTYQYLKSASVE